MSACPLDIYAADGGHVRFGPHIVKADRNGRRTCINKPVRRPLSICQADKRTGSDALPSVRHFATSTRVRGGP